MTLKDKLIGLWVVALWALAHVGPGVWLALDTPGSKGMLLWTMVVGEVVLTAGLLLGWRLFRYLALAQMVVHVLVFSTVAWVFVFVAFAYGLHGNELPILGAVGLYVAFMAWAFFYMNSPGVRDHFATALNPRP